MALPRISFLAIAAAVIAGAVLSSCARPEVHIHDRHSLSYPLVARYAKNHRGTTLVLLDYHHDVGPLGEGTVSSNWVGELLAEGTVERVIWVSGRDLLLPNRNARIAWLRRKLSSFPPSRAQEIEARVQLADWADLSRRRIPGPVAVTLDFDLFCHDPGNPPERFLDEISVWISRQRPELLTLALSAAYEKDPAFAWGNLDRFVREYASAGGASASWFLECGERRLGAEGDEELAAWKLWEGDRATFGRRDLSFLPAAAIWNSPPQGFRRLLLSIPIRPGDASAADGISAWRDHDLARLEGAIPLAESDAILASAGRAVEGGWRGEPEPFPGLGKRALGFALRLEARGRDRGCLAFYEGAADPSSTAAACARGAMRDPRYPPVLESERNSLELELSVFGPWRPMKDPLDFRPGFDSLLVRRGKDVTILQAPVAAERGYDRVDFLERLSLKAGLGTGGWKGKDLEFLRAATVWSRRSLVEIEALMPHQKNEKK